MQIDSLETGCIEKTYFYAICHTLCEKGIAHTYALAALFIARRESAIDDLFLYYSIVYRRHHLSYTIRIARLVTVKRAIISPLEKSMRGSLQNRSYGWVIGRNERREHFREGDYLKGIIEGQECYWK